MKISKIKCIDCDGTGKVEVIHRTPREKVITLLNRTGIANESYIVYHAGAKKSVLVKLVKDKVIKRHKKSDRYDAPMYSLREK